MLHRLALLALVALSFSGCGPDKPNCTGPVPAFHVELTLQDGPLAADTVVDVKYGGTGTDQFSLAEPHANHKVIFCTPSKRDCKPQGVAGEAAGAAGDAGSAGDSPSGSSGVESLCCDLWTAGATTLTVHATGLDSMAHRLYPRDGVCTVTRTIVLDSPDAG